MFPLRSAAFMTLATTVLAGSVLNSLPDCWDSCSDYASGSTCAWWDSSCICDLSNDSAYLATTVSCAKEQCGNDWDSSDVDRFLSPIELTCSLTLSGISQDRVDDANNAAMADTSSSSTEQPTSQPEPTPQPTTDNQPSQPDHPFKPSTTHKAKTHDAEPEQTTLKATIVQSSTTAVVEQPFVFGTNGVSSGERSTSIIVQTINIIPVPVSTGSATKSGSYAGHSPANSSASQTAENTASPTSTSEGSSGAASSTDASSSDSGSNNGGDLFDGAGVMLAPKNLVTLALVAAAVGWAL